jgi:carboxymethylenebutenolidase
MIREETRAGDMRVFIARPDGPQAGRFPAVAVIHEIYGVTAHIRDMTERLAEAGFLAAAPNLYHRTAEVVEFGFDQTDQAFKVRRALTEAMVLEDLRAVAAHLDARPDVRQPGRGIIGFCFGGRVANLALAHRLPGYRAAVSCYGSAVETPAPPEQAPILFFFGGKDQYYPTARIDAVRRRLVGKPHRIVMYPDAGHGFFDRTHPKRHHAASAEDAWPQALAFLREHLG